MPSRSELANAIRALSMDAVQKAKSGHPGMPMGMADIAQVLWCDHLKHNPTNPKWVDRDRFILSNGHGSMLQYSLLHLAGYDLGIDDLKQFRQLHSRTPGHPEYGYTPGVETTTGPLGQGLANAVGFAMAEKTLAAQFNRKGHTIVDHNTYVFLGDGCLMEGVSHEVSSLAGTLGLGKLIAFYDDNGISIDGEVAGWFTDDTVKRFEAYGWQVIPRVNGHDPEEIQQAIETARENTDQPTLICCKTIIGFGSPNKEGKEDCHGAPLGDDEIKLTRERLGWEHDAFDVPEDIYADWNAAEAGSHAENEWNERLAAYSKAYPELAADLLRRLSGDLPADFSEKADAYIADVAAKGDTIASRKASQNSLNTYGPMLPELLSNGLCSLNPHVDRLAMVCEMTISESGNLSSYKFYEAVIQSHARLTYTKVGKMLMEAESDEGQRLRAEYSEVVPHLESLHGLYHALRAARDTRGAIDFETTETRIMFGEERKIEKIVPVTRNDAHKLIEECMLCANVATARFLSKLKVPSLYRVHEGPKEQKLTSLRAYLGELGLNLGGGEEPSPSDYQLLAEQIEGRPDRHVIQTMMLRSMRQAVYSPDNKGHFGLAYTAYTHFTSPIRRYPDLLVHRAIRFLIRSEGEPNHVDNPGKLPKIPAEKLIPYSQADMVAIGEQCSMTERRADDATRDVVSWLKCQFMESHIGDVFEGVISGVANFGLFIQLNELHIDGLVHVANLDSDYYHFDEVNLTLTGESSGRKFGLGDGVTVRVAAVHTEDRKIDLQLESSTPSGKGRPKGGSNKGGGGNRRGGNSEREKLAKGDIPKAKPKRKGPPRGKKAARRSSKS